MLTTMSALVCLQTVDKQDQLQRSYNQWQWARLSSAKRPAKRSAKKTYLAELLSTDLSQRWDKTRLSRFALPASHRIVGSALHAGWRL